MPRMCNVIMHVDCKIIILSDNYTLPFNVGLFIFLTYPTQPTANMNYVIVPGSDKRQ